MPKQTYTTLTTYDTARAHGGDIKYAQSALPSEPGFVAYHASFSQLLGSAAKLHLVEQRADKFAHEAGVYIKSTEKNYFTSNYQSGRTVENYAVDAKTHEITEDKWEGVVNANGGELIDSPEDSC